MLKNEEITTLGCYGSTLQMLIRDGCLLMNDFPFHGTWTWIQDKYFFDQPSSVACVPFVSIYLSNLKKEFEWAMDRACLGREREKERERAGERDRGKERGCVRETLERGGQ